HERDERRRSRGRSRPGRRRTRRLSDAAPILPAAQILPVLGPERAQDRLQGREAAAAFRFRARQDRAEPHHGGLCQEAARARAGDQTGALPGPVALRDALKETRVMVQVILLERVEKLGQMGQVVDVRPGYARNFLLPQKKALRATKENLAYFEKQRVQLDAATL